MKILFSALILCFASVSFAQNSCDKWAGNERLVKAIQVVAADQGYSFEELCTVPHILDVEAQPSRLLDKDGTIIPHVRVQLHMSESSCLFMVRDSNWTITESRCYSGF